MEYSYRSYSKYGSGCYGDNAYFNITVVEENMQSFLEALENVDFEKKHECVFTIADYGTADGSVSMSVFTTFIERIKAKYGTEQEVQILYEDTPINDFNSLFCRLHGLKQRDKSYLSRFDGVFAFACGMNFYSQCFPSSTINIGISTLAVHWLRKRPCVLKSSLIHYMSDNVQERNAFANEAEESWKLFLINRAKELAPGGCLIMLALGSTKKRDREVTYHGNSIETILTEHWTNMLADKRITEDEFSKASFIVYFRDEDEMAEPLIDKNSDVYKAGLRLVSVETSIVPSKIRQSFCIDNNAEDGARRQYAEKFVAAIRNYSNSVFLSALNNERTETEKLSILEELYDRLKDDVAANPEQHDKMHVFVILHCKKTVK